jgi:hypothetical protein
VLDPAGRQVSDVTHSISAVASRSLEKAEKFISDFAPKGACAQLAGQVKEAPVAVGSYEELVARTVSQVGMGMTCEGLGADRVDLAGR